MTPTVVITITCTDSMGVVTAQRELRASQPLDVLRSEIMTKAIDAAGHAADLIDTHVAALKRSHA